MFLSPAFFQDFLTRNQCSEEIYKAVGKDDLSEVVITALNVLRKTHQLPTRIPDVKNELFSIEHRKKGNIAYEEGNYQIALMYYNLALLTAPKNSKAMVFAISNRSALFLKLKAYKACLKDVDTCFSLGCPSELIDKLTKRKRDVSVLVQEKELDFIITAIVRKHSECTPNNSEIPCATSDVKAVGSTIPKIVASNDIKGGTVICSERAYVSYTDPYNSLYSCHFCQKMSLNLIPCDGCTFALFCDDDCKSKCFDEYHKYECPIMSLIRDIAFGPIPNLMIKTTLKLRTKCKSWRELIDASYNMGIERIKSSSVKEIFDVDSIFSVLNLMDNKPFIYGVKYVASFVCASFIHYLDEIPLFFPKDLDEKTLAMSALGRIMMFLSLYTVPWKVALAAKILKTEQICYHEKSNASLFSFIGKLKNSCTPNVVAVYRNNKMSLIAKQSIKTGEELTISYQYHCLEHEYEKHSRNVTTFLYHGKVCTCNICRGEPCLQKLSKSQRKVYNSLNLKGIDQIIESIHITAIYEKLLEALDHLKDVPQSQEYKEVFTRFKKCLIIFEYHLNDNTILDNTILDKIIKNKNI